MIRRTLILASLLILMILPLAGQAKTSAWLSEPLQIDGMFNDWLQYPRAYLEDIGTSYGLVNDGEYLYILVQQQAAMGPGGGQVRLWLNADGKKKKTFGLLLQGRHQQAQLRERQQGANRPELTQGQRPEGGRGGGPGGGMDLSEGLYGLQGEESSPVLITCTDDSRIQIQTSSLDNNVTFYELRIPLQGAPEQGVMFTLEPGEKFRIGFEAMPQQSGKDEGGRRGGGPGGGMGGAPPGGGGGMGGSPPGGGRGGGPGMGGGGAMQMKTVWIKYQLAEQDD
ncbi:hypothetical protein KQI52_03295 [bacterium]|nr:hypothetical protein [bacterium]